MRIAPDGKPYDIDNLHKEPNETEVEIIQFLRPDGKRRYMICGVPFEIARKATNMILSAEELRTGEVAIYARFKDEDEYKERLMLANNDAGERNPAIVLIEIIEKKFSERIKDNGGRK